jgi:hypothetical protein
MTNHSEHMSEAISNIIDIASACDEQIQLIILMNLKIIVESCDQREVAVTSSILDAMSDIQLNIKYLEFDLLATRSERDYYKRLAND